jgi:ribosomal protection tetracycline resistance protein
MQKIRNIGIIAHVDAGKTTITEQMLYAAGEVRTPGSVDGGTSSTDTLQVERDRGISVRATTVRFTYQDTIFNLIDTPGHSDFAGEVERAMAALDGAVLVLSAAEGVEAQTTLLWNYLQELGIPTIIFINKIDRMTADVEGVIEVIQTELTDAAVVLQKPVHAATPEASIAPVVLDAQDETSTALLEKIVEHDDGLLSAYLDGTIPSPEQLHPAVQHSCTPRCWE